MIYIRFQDFKIDLPCVNARFVDYVIMIIDVDARAGVATDTHGNW